jgi:hypothetical protein
MLMLARVDGKSPVEYLDSARAQFVRDFVRDRLWTGRVVLASVTNGWFERLRTLPSIR